MRIPFPLISAFVTSFPVTGAKARASGSCHAMRMLLAQLWTGKHIHPSVAI